MAKYLISFPSAAMVVPDGERAAAGRDAHAVIDEAKAAGVYVFGGGIDEDVPPVRVSADGTVAMGGYPWAPTLDGGFTVTSAIIAAVFDWDWFFDNWRAAFFVKAFGRSGARIFYGLLGGCLLLLGYVLSCQTPGAWN